MKEYKIGESTIIVHSPLLNLTREERIEWIKAETERGNPVLKEIRKAIKDCYRK
jgi:hypothetical protein